MAAFNSEIRATRAHEWEAMWAAGMTCRQIAETIGGWSPAAVKVDISRLRASGYDFPHRRPDLVSVALRMVEMRMARRAA